MTLRFFDGQQYLRQWGDARATITLRKDNSISLNAATAKLAGNGWKYVLLGLDRDAKELYIKFTQDGKAKGVHAVRQPKRGGLIVSCRNFFKWGQLDISESRVYDVSYDESKRMLTAKVG